MKKYFIIQLISIFIAISGYAQKRYSFTNEFANWKARTDYFNWKVYIKADGAYLNTIKQIEYYLDPTYKNSKRVITQANGGENFTLCTNGWGEFTLRIKIVFKNSNTKSINETYFLDLRSPAKKNKNYKCP